MFWCIIGFGVGIGLFIYGFRLLQRRRLILDTPASKIRSASMGLAEISGLAVGPYVMVAPITARPCYYYRTLVWEWKQCGKNKQWVKVAGESMHVPFFIDDNTGRMLVDPRGADLDLHRDFEQEFCDSFFTTKEPAPDGVRAFLARHGVATSNKIKVQEFCIKPKNSLFVLGTVAENPGIEVTSEPILDGQPMDSFSTQGFKFSINLFSNTEGTAATGSPAYQVSLTRQLRDPEIIHLSPGSNQINTSDMTQQQKIAAALLKAGISSPAAWSAAGLSDSDPSATAVQVLPDPDSSNGNLSAASSSEQKDAFVRRPPVVLTKGINNKTFMISWRSQREIANSLAWKCTLMIWGGPALALLSLYTFLRVKNLL